MPTTSSRFQSLLWWIGLAGSSSRSAAYLRRTRGFNPCCGGSGSLGSGRIDGRAVGPRVSILVVVDRARWDVTRADWVPLVIDVSILVVVDRARWAPGTRPVRRRAGMFQSLLWWIGLAGDVSIAVQAANRQDWFQSLLWWIGLAGTTSSIVGVGSRT